MSKRIVPLVVVAVLLLTASSAMATHCERCVYDPDFGRPMCEVSFTSAGYTWCTDTTVCRTSGITCGPHPFIEFAEEFEIVSVERLDEEPKPSPKQVQLAEVR